jgi:hypothetical protein
LGSRGIDRYVLRTLAGQMMRAEVSAPGTVVLAIQGADGAILLGRSSGATSWSGRLPKTQDYILTLSTTGPATSYALRVSVDPVGQ